MPGFFIGQDRWFTLALLSHNFKMGARKAASYFPSLPAGSLFIPGWLICAFFGWDCRVGA